MGDVLEDVNLRFDQYLLKDLRSPSCDKSEETWAQITSRIENGAGVHTVGGANTRDCEHQIQGAEGPWSIHSLFVSDRENTKKQNRCTGDLFIITLYKKPI